MVTLAYVIDQVSLTIKDIRLQHEVNKQVLWSIPIPFANDATAQLDRDPAVRKPELPVVNAKIQRQEGRDEAVES